MSGRLGVWARARLPAARDLATFATALRRPTRLSTVRAAVDAVYVTITLRKRGARKLLAGGAGPLARVDADRSRRVAAAVDAGFALVPAAPTCLRRSIVLVRELRRLRLAGTIHIGVRTVDGRVEAHAWVQTLDSVINDELELTTTYAELVTGDKIDKLLPLLK